MMKGIDIPKVLQSKALKPSVFPSGKNGILSNKDKIGKRAF